MYYEPPKKFHPGGDQVQLLRPGNDVHRDVKAVVLQEVAAANGTRLSVALVRTHGYSTRSAILTSSVWATASTVDMRGSEVRYSRNQARFLAVGPS